jgi:ABC-2 type transport system permease protein
MSGGWIASKISEEAADVADRRFAVVDRSGHVLPELLRRAAERDRDGIWSRDEPREQDRPRFVPEEHRPAPGEDPVVALSDRVRADEIFGFLVVGADVLAAPPSPGAPPDAADRELSWYTDTPTYDELPDWIRAQVGDLARERRLADAGIDRGLVERLTQGVWVRTMGLAGRTAAGEVRAAQESSEAATKALPLALSLLLFILVMSTAPALLNTVLEEKMQKIAEVLVATVDPFDLLLGKLLATAGVALTLSVIYLGAALVFAGTSDVVPPQVLEAITPSMLAWYVLFQVMALLSFGAMYAAIGAACSEIQDAQNLMGPLMIVTMVPLFFIGPVLSTPDGTLSRVLSLVPTATPMLMMMRVSAPPGPAWWELVLAVLITGGFTVATVWAAGRIFRVGILSQGQAPSWRRLAQWLRTR